MKYTVLSLAAVTLIAGFARSALAHCEVPCGIYDDQRRFEQMLEDQMTVAKAITNIISLASQSDAKAHNQLARWVLTKENHATNIQHVISQYFMTQRIKPAADAAAQKDYVAKLTAAHAVMVAAMKSKQDADPATADALKTAILEFYRAYEGKEPALGK